MFKVTLVTFAKYQLEIIQRSFSLWVNVLLTSILQMLTCRNSHPVKTDFSKLILKELKFLYFARYQGCSLSKIDYFFHIYLNVKELFYDGLAGSLSTNKKQVVRLIFSFAIEKIIRLRDLNFLYRKNYRKN